MKNRRNIIAKKITWVAGLFFLIQGCKEEELMTFDSPSSIYFYSSSVSTTGDSIGMNFGYVPDYRQDTTIRFIFRCTGQPVDHDREIGLQVADTSTGIQGVHYVLPEQVVLKAGRITDTLFLKILRDETLRDKEYELAIALVDNENFNTKIVSRPLSYRIFMSDIVSVPGWWHVGSFAAFSQTKLKLMVELLGIDPSSITSLSPDDRKYYGVFVQRYLNTMEAAGTPVYDEDGSKMTMGTEVQS